MFTHIFLLYSLAEQESMVKNKPRKRNSLTARFTKWVVPPFSPSNLSCLFWTALKVFFFYSIIYRTCQAKIWKLTSCHSKSREKVSPTDSSRLLLACLTFDLPLFFSCFLFFLLPVFSSFSLSLLLAFLLLLSISLSAWYSCMCPAQYRLHSFWSISLIYSNKAIRSILTRELKTHPVQSIVL